MSRRVLWLALLPIAAGAVFCVSALTGGGSPARTASDVVDSGDSHGEARNPNDFPAPVDLRAPITSASTPRDAAPPDIEDTYRFAGTSQADAPRNRIAASLVVERSDDLGASNSAQSAAAPALPEYSIEPSPSAVEFAPDLLPPAGAEVADDVVASFDGVLMLHNGRILEGHIVRRADDYLLVLDNGRVAVLATEVMGACRSLDEAYDVRRLHTALDSPAGRLELARWCWSVGLHEQAVAEARAAAELAPDSATIARVAARFEQSLRDGPAGPSDASPALPVEADTPVYDPADRIPEAAYDAFVSQVQPLLMNSCASAGCHGRPTSAAVRPETAGVGPRFLLWRVSRSRSSPRIVQENLDATVEYVDRDHPSSSPLLWEPLGPHGERGRPIFRGRDDPHYVLLREWVNSLARQPVRNQESGIGNRESGIRSQDPESRPDR